ncbi:hypothetical protein PO909_022620 [Leuciscus waleckii]
MDIRNSLQTGVKGQKEKLQRLPIKFTRPITSEGPLDPKFKHLIPKLWKTEKSVSKSPFQCMLMVVNMSSSFKDPC